ncbi:neurobeachin, partial [Trichonephila clavata]
SQFRFEGEASSSLPENLKRVLYDGKLSSAIVFMYNPVATDSQLCLQAAPKGNISFFVHTPHALMLQDVKAITTYSIHSTLNSIGGIQVLFPLLGQLDIPTGISQPKNQEKKLTTCATLIGFVCDLVENSPTVQQHMIQNKAFLVISYLLQKASRDHITEEVLLSFLNLTKYLVTVNNSNSELLLKQLLDHILFNPALWIYTPTVVQTKLFTYLATDFLADTQIYSNVRRISTVLQTMHTLKYYYWVVNPRNKSGITPKGIDGPRPCQNDIMSIRAYILLFLKQLILKGNGVKEDELQSILNYLTTVHEDENLHDVLQMLMSLMSEHPASMVPAFDIKNGISNALNSRTNLHLSVPLQHFEFLSPLDQHFPNWGSEAVSPKLEKEAYMTVFKLLASTNEVIRLQALKLLGYFLSRSTHKRKHDVMGPHNLYMLLADRLLLHSDHVSLSTYNVLYEILTEHVSSQILYQKHPEPESHYRLENPMILKVIATLIRQSKHCEELMETKKLFLSDMTLLCNNNKENRRTVLQMSVWQEWLIAMAYIHPQNAEEQKLSDMVYSLFRMLLHHAIKYEYGGWRVWVDTLAIVHSKVSFEEFKLQFSQMYEQYEQRRSDHLTDPALRKQKPISTISGLENNHRALNVVNPPKPDITHKDSNENFKTETVKSITEVPSSLKKETDCTDPEESNKESKNSSPSSLSTINDDSREKSTAVQVPEIHDGLNKPNYNSSLCEALLTADDHRPVPVESEERGVIEALPIQTHADDEVCSVNLEQATTIDDNNELHLSNSEEIELESINGAKIDTENPQPNSPSDSGFLSLSVTDESKGKTADDELTYENELALDDESAATEKSPDEIPNEILDDGQPIKSFEDIENIAYENSTFNDPIECISDVKTLEESMKDSIPQTVNESSISQECNDSFQSNIDNNTASSQSSNTNADVLSADLSNETVNISNELNCSESNNEALKQGIVPEETRENIGDGIPACVNDTEVQKDEISDIVVCSETQESVKISTNIQESIGENEDESVSISKKVLPAEEDVVLNQADHESNAVSDLDNIEESSKKLSHSSENISQEILTNVDISSNDPIEVVELPEDKQEIVLESPAKQQCPNPTTVVSEKEDKNLTDLIKSQSSVELEESKVKNVSTSEIKSTISDNQDATSLLNTSSENLQKIESPKSVSANASPVSQAESPVSSSDKDAKVFDSNKVDESSPFKKREEEEEEIEKPTGISTIEGQLEKERRLMAEAGGDQTDEQILNQTASISPKGSSETASLGEPADETVSKINNENAVVSTSQNVVPMSEADVAPTRRSRSVIMPRKQTSNQIQRPKSMSMNQKSTGGNGRQMFNSGPTRPPFRIPEFRWSPIHQRLLSDLLFSLETDIQVWRSHTTKTVIDFVNSGENAIFVINTVHLISQVADNIIIACGGLLPLLASATSPNHELDVIEPTQGMSIEVAVAFLQRLVNMTDVLVFASSLSFSELEAEKNMSSGGILRQCLRLVCTSAVRNCLECRERSLPQTPVIPHPSSSMSRDSRPSPIQALIGGVQPSAKVDFNIVENLGGQSSPIRDPEKLLQDMDVNRLRAVIYRDVDETKQAQFLALAVVYFISVLMVSKYRDILEPPPPPSSFTSRQSANSEMQHYTTSATMSSSASQTVVDSDVKTNGQLTESASVCNEDGEDEVIIVEDTDSSILAHLHSSGAPVSAVIRTQKLKTDHVISQDAELMVNGAGESSSHANEELAERDIETDSVVNLTSVPEDVTFSVADTRVSNSDPSIMTSSLAQNGYSRTLDSMDGCQQSRTADDLHITSLGTTDDFHMLSSSLSREATLTQKLESALGSVCPLLREIMLDFAPFLSRTLVGSHGQDLLVEGKGLCTFKNSTSVVELVMLLCSQEWQNSLQKHAGLAFIELINEGRLLSHAMKDHIVRVANEAEFILNRMRADDVLKHADFESLCAQTVLDRKEEEKMCDHLITAARRRDSVTASRNIEKILNILTNKHGAWGNKISIPQREYLKLDSWEDDARRRKRFVQNPYGSSHPEATLKAAIEHGAPEDAILQAREEFHQHLAITRRQQQHHLQSSDLLDDSDLWDDKDLDAELAGPVSFSTKCRLIAPGVVVPGMLSITQAEMFFEVDEDDAEYKKMDPERNNALLSSTCCCRTLSSRNFLKRAKHSYSVCYIIRLFSPTLPVSTKMGPVRRKGHAKTAARASVRMYSYSTSQKAKGKK